MYYEAAATRLHEYFPDAADVFFGSEDIAEAKAHDGAAAEPGLRQVGVGSG